MRDLKITINLYSSIFKYDKKTVELEELAVPMSVCDIYQIMRHIKGDELVGYFWIFDRDKDLLQLREPVNLDELNFILKLMDSRKFPKKDLTNLNMDV